MDMDMDRKKIFELAVVTGVGEDDFFVEKEIVIPPSCPPVFKVKDINEWVEVFEKKVICGKVIFNAWLWKDITYKTADHACGEGVCGTLRHFTLKIPFGGSVDIGPGAKDGDKAVLLGSCIEGKNDNWTGPDEKCGEVRVFTKLVEKTVIKLRFKATREEQFCIEGAHPVEPGDKMECRCGEQGHPEKP